MFKRLSTLISRLNLAKAQRIETFRILNTKINFTFLIKLDDIGVIRGFEVEYNELIVYMKYVDKRVPFTHISLVGTSKKRPSVRMLKLLRVSDKYGSSIFVLSTGYGFLTHAECITLRCTGYMVCRIDL